MQSSIHRRYQSDFLHAAQILAMKFAAVSVFLALCLAVGVDSGTLQPSNNGITLNGNANVQFYGKKEDVWASMSNGNFRDSSLIVS